MGTKFYTVQMGDNLSTIGQRLGIPWQEIARLNKLPNPNKLRPNDVLMIPDTGSEEDRLRVDAAKAEPAGQAAVLARPSQTPKQKPAPGFDVVDEFSAKTRPMDQPLPNQTARDITTPPSAGSVGSGSLENIKPTTKPYPPTPAQLGYPQFWTDFLDKELPTALQGATGPGSAFVRAAGKLKDFAQYPYAEPNAARADFYRKAGRFGPSEDPNYTQVFQKENQLGAAKPEPYQGPEMGTPVDPNDPFNFITPQGQAADAGPGAGAFVRAILKQYLGPETNVHNMQMNPANSMAAKINATRGNVDRLGGQASEKASEMGPGSSYAKGTTVSKGSSPQTSNPFSDAIRKGMEKRLHKHGHDVADQALKLAGMSFEGGAVPPQQVTTWDAGNPLVQGRTTDKQLRDRPGAATEDGKVGTKQATNAGDVIPLNSRKSLDQNLYGTEGARPYQGGANNVLTFERPLSQQEKYDAAVAKQQQDTLKGVTFPEFAQDFHAKSRIYGGFKELPSTFVHDSLKSFYRNPEATLQDLQAGIKDLPSGPLRQEAIRLRQMLEEETF